MERTARANVESKTLFAPGSPYYVVARGVRLRGRNDMRSLAGAFGLPLLTAARHVRQQPILEKGGHLRVVGGHYRIETNDTRDSILAKFPEIPSWEDVEEANPFFDWSVPDAERPGPCPTLELPAGETIRLPAVEHEVGPGERPFRT